MLVKRLYSLALLGLNFAAHWLRKLRPSRKAGLALFQEYYGADRVGVFRAEDLARFPEFSRCTACNVCRSAVPPGYAGPPPDALPLALSRTPTFAWAARADLPPGVSWAEAEAVCPVAVPLGAIAKLVVDQASLTVPASPEHGSERR